MALKNYNNNYLHNLNIIAEYDMDNCESLVNICYQDQHSAVGRETTQTKTKESELTSQQFLNFQKNPEVNNYLLISNCKFQ